MARCASMTSAGVTPVEIELHGKRLGEQTRIAVRDARAAAFAHADLDDAERFEGAHRVAGDDAAGAEAGGQFLFGAEEVAGLELLGKQVVADLRDHLRRQRRRAAGKHDAGGRIAADLHRLPQGRARHGEGSILDPLILRRVLTIVKIVSYKNLNGLLDIYSY